MAGLTFSDTSGKQGIIQGIEFETGLGDAGISGASALLAHFTRLINQSLNRAVVLILQGQDDWDWDDVNNTNYPVATTPLVAAQRDYTFPVSLGILKIKRVDVTYDGTNYYKCNPFDSAETGLGLGNDTNTDGRFIKQYPYYDIRDNAIWLYPTASSSDVVSGGLLRIEFFRNPVEFLTSDTTKVPGIDPAFHRYLVARPSSQYATTKNLPNAKSLSEEVEELEGQMQRWYGNKDLDRVWEMKSSYTNYNDYN